MITADIKIQGSIKQSIERSHICLILFSSLFIFCFSTIIFRLIELGTTGRENLRNNIAIIDNPAVTVTRADIIDRNGVILASNLKTVSLYANPSVMIDPVEAVKKLYTVLPHLNKEKLLLKLTSNKQFTWIKRNLHPEEEYAVNNLGIPGIYFKNEEKRVYPSKNLLSHLVGVAGIDGNGLSGIEKEFDKHLSQDHKKIQLSIDIRIQEVLHNELYKRYTAHHAESASGVVINANTGEIIAMVSIPDFNPNIPSLIDRSKTFNYASKALYEMGSTFKTFTMAMALDSDIIKMSDVYDATNPIHIAKYTIRDAHGKGRKLTVPEIFMYSSNIGTAKIADDIGADIQKSFLRKLGLLYKLPLEIPETSSPKYPEPWGRTNTMTIGFGHGISVTPVHIASAVSAIVNGGILYPPTLLKKNNTAGKRVIKQKTSDTMRKLLRLVVAHGTGRNANANGYFVGGKTGTGEKSVNGHYSKTLKISSFVAAFPINDPKYIVLAVLDKPKGIKSTFGYATAGWTAAPVVKHVIERIAPILGIRPIDPEDPVRKEFLVDYKLKEQKIASF